MFRLKSKALATILTVSTVTLMPLNTVMAAAGDYNLQTGYTNEISEDSMQGTVNEYNDNVMLRSSYKGVYYYDTIDAAAAYLRQQLVNHEEDITVRIRVMDKENVIGELMDAAMEHTGVPNEGDYIYWQYGDWSGEIPQGESFQTDTGWYCTVKYHVEYTTTFEQEKVVSSMVSETIKKLNINTASDYVKAKTIYSYICENVEFDYEHADDPSYLTQYTAYAALVDKKAASDGYAVLFYRMLLECGIDCRMLSGTMNGISYRWNIVKLGDYYYLCDPSLDSVIYDKYQTFGYFMKGFNDFDSLSIEGEEGDNKHNFRGEYFSAEYQKKHPMSDVCYVGVDADANGIVYDPQYKGLCLYSNGRFCGFYNGWYKSGTDKYWIDNGIVAVSKEVYDPASDGWYWFDEDGTMAKNKDAFVPTNEDRTEGKWVRYDENGIMKKGWDVVTAVDSKGNVVKSTYYFDKTTGVMIKGIGLVEGTNGESYYAYFDEITGCQRFGEFEENGRLYYYDEETGAGLDQEWLSIEGKDYWYEKGERQGYDINNPAYRGKEIYDAKAGAWFWLDNVLQGAKAVDKDVYQESAAGIWGQEADQTGKWVRYDAKGRMVKGWNSQDGKLYYFDKTYGTMAKGHVTIDGKSYYFDEATGELN